MHSSLITGAVSLAKDFFYVHNEDNQLLNWSHALKSNFCPYKKKGLTFSLGHHGITSLLTSTQVEFEFGDPCLLFLTENVRTDDVL